VEGVTGNLVLHPAHLLLTAQHLLVGGEQNVHLLGVFLAQPLFECLEPGLGVLHGVPHLLQVGLVVDRHELQLEDGLLGSHEEAVWLQNLGHCIEIQVFVEGHIGIALLGRVAMLLVELGLFFRVILQAGHHSGFNFIPIGAIGLHLQI